VHMLEGVRRVNLQQVDRMLGAIQAYFHGSVQGKLIAVWGLSFKPGTDDVRASPSLALIQKLVTAGANVQAYDPVASTPARNALRSEAISFHDSAMDACKQADGLAVMTEWEEFKAADLAMVATQLRNPVIF